MAAKTLEELLGTLSGEEKKLFEKTLNDNPELKGGWLRQDDYSRKTQDLKARESEYQEAVAYRERMEPWSQEAYDRLHALEEEGVIATEPDGKIKVLYADEKKRLETELEEARRQALAGGDMDPKELDRRVQEIVKANGGATTEEVKALVASEARKMAEEAFDAKYKETEEKFNKNTIPWVAGFASANAVFAGRFERETGEPWTQERHEELLKLMSAENNYNAYQVGDKMLAPHKAKKDQEAEVNRRVQEELARRGLPGGGSEAYIPQPLEKGNLKAMMERQDGPGDVESLIRSSAVKAATELQAEGKF